MIDMNIERLHAQLWGAFGEGAGMGFSGACVDEAIALGYYDSIKRNSAILLSDPAKLEETRNCAVRAGNLAAFLAKEAPSSERIEPEHFRQACEDVKERITRVRDRMLANAIDPHTVQFGGGCG